MAGSLAVAFAARATFGETNGPAIVDHDLHADEYIRRAIGVCRSPDRLHRVGRALARVLGVRDFPPDDHM